MAIMKVGIEVDKESELYKKATELCEGLEVRFGVAFSIPFPMQDVDTGCGNDKCNALRMRVDYRKGGHAYYDGPSYPSSYYLNITPVELTEHSYRCIMFSGCNCTIAECNRNTAKQRGLAVKAVQDDLVETVYSALAYYKIKF